jgi:hypothetical protein
MIERREGAVKRQGELLPLAVAAGDLALMRRIGERTCSTMFYGVGRLAPKQVELIGTGKGHD